jgi:GT2 family glycosyltransferase
MITIVLTIHNKQSYVADQLRLILETSSRFTTSLVIVLDGCTDGTRSVVDGMAHSIRSRFELKVISTNDVWETMANNIGLKAVKTRYAILMQDDMHIKQRNWDKKLLSCFRKYDAFAVTGRDVHGFMFSNGRFIACNVRGRDFPFFSSGTRLGNAFGYAMREFSLYWIYRIVSPVAKGLCANRGPLLLEMSRVRHLGYFDERYAPFELDDVDFCCRGFKHYGLLSIACPIYYSEVGGSKISHDSSSNMSEYAIAKNSKLLMQDHADLASRC